MMLTLLKNQIIIEFQCDRYKVWWQTKHWYHKWTLRTLRRNGENGPTKKRINCKQKRERMKEIVSLIPLTRYRRKKKSGWNQSIGQSKGYNIGASWSVLYQTMMIIILNRSNDDWGDRYYREDTHTHTQNTTWISFPDQLPFTLFS